MAPQGAVNTLDLLGYIMTSIAGEEKPPLPAVTKAFDSCEHVHFNSVKLTLSLFLDRC